MEYNLRAMMRCVVLAIAAVLGVMGCERSTARQRSGEALENAEASPEGASRPARPARAASRVRFRVECFDVYSGCPAVRGLPALSGDGARVAIADTGPEDGRDEFVLTVRILDATTSDELQAFAVMTQEDRVSGLNPDTEEMSPALRAAIESRLQAVQQVLGTGDFRPLIALGSVSADQPGESTRDFRAHFDGRDLTVLEGQEERWKKALEALPERDMGSLRCGPFPVAGATVWVNRSPGLVLALVHYTSTHLCDLPSRFFAWR